jgi:CBS domain-containing protein
MKTVKQWLASQPRREVISVRSDTTVFDALVLMAEHDIGAVPVLDGVKVVGIFSERDYARHVALKGRSSRETLIQEIMTDKVFYVAPERTIGEVMALMTDKRIRHLPVLDADQTMVGIISIGDVVKETISERDLIIHQLEAYIST